MSSETERITNEVMNRHPWDRLEERLDVADFEDAESRQRTSDDLPTTDTSSGGMGESALEFPQ